MQETLCGCPVCHGDVSTTGYAVQNTDDSGAVEVFRRLVPLLGKSKLDGAHSFGRIAGTLMRQMQCLPGAVWLRNNLWNSPWNYIQFGRPLV